MFNPVAQVVWTTLVSFRIPVQNTTARTVFLLENICSISCENDIAKKVWKITGTELFVVSSVQKCVATARKTEITSFVFPWYHHNSVIPEMAPTIGRSSEAVHQLQKPRPSLQRAARMRRHSYGEKSRRGITSEKIAVSRTTLNDRPTSQFALPPFGRNYENVKDFKVAANDWNEKKRLLGFA